MAIYVNNNQLSQALKIYRDECELNDTKGEPHPPIPAFIAKSFYDIANHYSTKHSFVRYSFREDMVSEATLACCTKVLKYDANASPYAFAYFSRICFHVFLDMIHKEKTESYIKAKLFSHNPDESFDIDEADAADHTGDNIGQDFIPFFDVSDYEQKMQDKKDKARIKKLEQESFSKVTIEDFM